jgi:hypothetical protein
MTAEHKISDLTESLSNWAGIRTATGKKWFGGKMENTIGSRHSNDKMVLNYSSQKAKKFAAISDNGTLKEELSRVAELEPKLLKILEPNSELEKESAAELVFLGEYFSPLNFVPFLLTCWSILRVYIFPGISLMIPFIILILPYFILKFLMEVPVTTEQYIFVLKKIMIKSSSMLPMGLGGGGGGGGGGGSATATVTGALPFIFSVGQIMLQGYWNWKHLSAIDNIICENGKTIVEFMNSYQRISQILEKNGIKIMRNHWWCDLTDVRQIIAGTTLYPVYLRLHLQAIAEVDVWMSLGAKIRTGEACVVKWVETTNRDEIFIRLYGTFDTSCKVDSRISHNYSIGGSGGAGRAGGTGGAPQHNHFLLTGPNRGGKSTALRSLASSLVLAHTFGCALGTRALLSPIDHFSICLRPDDLPGLKSRFEREVEFAWGCLRKPGAQIILIDELFHSTNPPDAEESSRIFTKSLWRRRNIASIISTHLFDFVEDAPDSIGRLCCPAKMGEDGRLVFHYKIEQGICRVSSVKELIDGVRRAKCG